ncbi:MAG TPA: hypothetical protein VI565_08895, partial [Burkholderiales bacterium]|nr:hypothetical protein [Burkholderiales bacterium]
MTFGRLLLAMLGASLIVAPNVAQGVSVEAGGSGVAIDDDAGAVEPIFAPMPHPSQSVPEVDNTISTPSAKTAPSTLAPANDASFERIRELPRLAEGARLPSCDRGGVNPCHGTNDGAFIGNGPVAYTCGGLDFSRGVRIDYSTIANCQIWLLMSRATPESRVATIHGIASAAIVESGSIKMDGQSVTLSNEPARQFATATTEPIRGASVGVSRPLPTLPDFPSVESPPVWAPSDSFAPRSHVAPVAIESAVELSTPDRRAVETALARVGDDST